VAGAWATWSLRAAHRVFGVTGAADPFPVALQPVQAGEDGQRDDAEDGGVVPAPHILGGRAPLGGAGGRAIPAQQNRYSVARPAVDWDDSDLLIVVDDACLDGYAVPGRAGRALAH